MAKVQLSQIAMNVDVYPGLLPMDTVFLHGNLSNNVWWEPTLEILKRSAKPGYEGRAIMAEWRGCGGTDAPADESGMKMPLLAGDVIDLLQHLKAKKVNVVGHSTGGLIGLIAMTQAPQLFDRAFLLDSVGAMGIQFGPEMFDAFTQMSTDRNFCAAIMGATIHDNDATKPFFQKIVDAAFTVKKPVWHGVARALYDLNVTEDLAKLQHRVMVCHGEHDNLLPKEGSIALAKTIPNATFHEILGQGHCTNYENPELFVRLFTEFLFVRN